MNDDLPIEGTENNIFRPEFLYRYFPFPIDEGENDKKNREKYLKRAESVLKDSKLYFTSPEKINDPFDCKPTFSFNTTKRKETINFFSNCVNYTELQVTSKNRYIDRFNSGISAIESAFVKSTLRLTSRSGLLCLSESKDNILMWSHYASSHSGYCLQFKAGRYGFFAAAQKVKYCSQHPCIDCNDIGKVKSEKITKAFFLTKNDIWAYEKEWRILGIRNDDGEESSGFYSFPPELLTGVIFGCKVPIEIRKEIVALAKERKPAPTLYEAKMKEGEFGLDIVPLEEEA